MPEIRLQHVVSCSSEDPTHKAENLLLADTYRKWRCSNCGEKQNSVILQFEKAELIHSIDIGNEGSAFVEVLVGNSTSACEQDFEVILVSSFFMSPTESRSGTNLNRVRMFGPDKLAKGVLGKKWDRVKVVCTQPYNKNLPYGLSFIKFHSTPEADEKTPNSYTAKVTKLGQFVVKEEGSTESLRPGSLFFNRVTRPSTTTAGSPLSVSERPVASYAAATLQASGVTSPGSALLGDNENPLVQPSLRDLTPKDAAPTKRKFQFPREQGRKEKETPEGSGKKGTPSPSASKRPRVDHLTPKTEPTLGKRKAGAEGKQSAPSAPTPDFHSILGGTVLVLSGFQNPFRSELRDKALEMGARYRSDWDPECTHLICAFANTPKYTQVKALGGTVVRKDWILDCYKRRRRLSHKRYLLDRPASSSEEDEGDEEPRPPAQTAHGKAPQLETQSEQQDAVPSTSRQSERMATPERVYEGSTDEETEGAQRTVDDDSGCDTEDEIKRVQDHLQKQQEEESDPYAASTDENTDVEDTAPEISLPIPELPDLFVGKHFLLYGEFPNNERRLLTRYITAFNGSLEDYMSESVNFVVTAEDWDDRFDEALMENSNLAFVRPRWVYTCNEKQKLVPHQPYVVVPSI
ncbi:DNA repair protein XRCC1 isoform X1 [Hypanus sabinus]|uniref:DNA repair protein XRCC1 isoform X1 n=1 Tax=Hypanus sabinus TaxID=79690 RepID=UPI0028C446BE|nr:DNA repair protein XRCC1 isoform X1 [Hypanus sabinus]